MSHVVFFLLALIAYHYVVFPLMLKVLTFFFSRPYQKDTRDESSVSFVIAALNEEKVLRQKMENTLALDYPSHKIQIIVVLDGSTDGSYEIIKSYEEHGVICLHEPQRRGKTAALNKALKVATGDIVVFSDANSMFDKQAIRLLLRPFSDPTIGGVCGRKGIVSNEQRAASKGDSFYWDIESAIKTMQSEIGSISTGDGEIFAIRRALYQQLPESIINDDTAITFGIINAGYRVVYEPAAITYEEASLTLKDDFNVKVRMVAGGYQSLQLYTKDLFARSPLFYVQFISHKALRWLMPVLLVLLFAANIFSLDSLFLQYLLILQLLLYFAAWIGSLFKIKIFYLPLYYVLMNLAALIGLFRFARKDLGVKIWKKAER